MEKDISFNTTNESKQFKKPHIPAGEYVFKIVDIKPSEDNSKNYFILEIQDVKFEEQPVQLVWSAPTNDEYSPGTNVGKLFLSVGIDLGGKIMASALINLIGKCIVTDYAKSVPGTGTIVYSVVNELIIPEQKSIPEETIKESGIAEDGTM